MCSLFVYSPANAALRWMYIYQPSLASRKSFFTITPKFE